MIRVFLVDDHRLVRAALRSAMDACRDIEVCGEAESGEAAVEAVRANPPDVIVMDVAMPGIGGLEATRRLQASVPETHIVVLSAYTENPFPAQLMKAGARGFLSKNSDPDRVIAAIRKVAAGGTCIDAVVAERIASDSINGDAASGALDALSPRELQVLTMVTQGLGTQEIAAGLGISAKTVATYRYRLYEKLGVHNDVEMARMAMRHGIDPGPGSDSQA
jgi:two-component system, NarL family, invasion response regulator UvrY